MSHLETDKRHAEEYPMPSWLKAMLSPHARSAIRGLTTTDFPLHNYIAVMRHAVDGDTVEVNTVLREGEANGLGRQVVTERIRFLGYNAPELNKEGGKEAKIQLDTLLPAGSTIYVHTYYDRRSFNRLLAWAYANGSGDELLDVAQAMIASGHGVEA